MSTNNLPSMPEITDAFLNELLGEINQIIDDDQVTQSPTTNAERKQGYIHSQSAANNFQIQNMETNHTTSQINPDKTANYRGSKTMQKWLNGDQLIVHPVWIGNLPPHITTSQLRSFVESRVGKVAVSIHINNNTLNTQNQQKTYAFINLPTAEKQMLVLTLLNAVQWNNCKLMVRSNKPVKFQQSSFFSCGNSKISQQKFHRFQDTVVPAIMDLKSEISIASVSNLLQIYGININDLPNHVFGKKCTLAPNCHRAYCSFYHSNEEKELGRIISSLAMQNNVQQKNECKPRGISNGNAAKSRHTLLVQGLAENKREKIAEMFDVFGDVDSVFVNGNNMCYVRMRHAIDAQKIVHLFRDNKSGVCIDFGSYNPPQQQRPRLKITSVSDPLRQQTYNGNGQWSNGPYLQTYNVQRGISGAQFQPRIGYSGNLQLGNAYSNPGVQYSQMMPPQNGYGYGYF